MNVVVLDIGKTNVRIALVGDGGETRALHTRANRVVAGPYPHFDVDDLFAWMIGVLREIAREHRVDAIVPVTHGACAALIRGEHLALPVLDYECTEPETCADYDEVVDDFAETGSPRLPAGLNLGRQLHWQARSFPEAFRTAERLLPWPQYWAWRLSGVAAYEPTSLGCHTDLWSPTRDAPSAYAERAGLARLLPERVGAWTSLGAPTASIRAATGLPPTCRVLAGIHDSNASFLTHRAARSGAFSVVSTGTWFVVMARGEGPVQLNEHLDTQLVVDAFGCAVPTARFPGGREIAAIVESESFEALADATLALEWIDAGALVLPAFSNLGGPFRGRVGRIVGADEAGPRDRIAMAALYAALVTNRCLELVDAHGEIVLEGRFAHDRAFRSLLAALCFPRPVLVSADATGTLAGAALLARGRGAASTPTLERVSTHELDTKKLREHRERWNSHVRAD